MNLRCTKAKDHRMSTLWNLVLDLASSLDCYSHFHKTATKCSLTITSHQPTISRKLGEMGIGGTGTMKSNMVHNSKFQMRRMSS